MKAVLLLLIFGLVISLSIPANASPELEQMIAEKINKYRIEKGLNGLSYDHGIADVAKQHGEDMRDRDYFEHKTLGTNRNSIERGISAGYQFCGSSETIEKYHDTVSNIEEYKVEEKEYETKLKEYEETRQYFEQFRNDDIALHAKLVQDEQLLDKKFTELNMINFEINNQIDSLNQDITNNKIGIGLAENIMETVDIPMNDLDFYSNEIIEGWKKSLGHNQVMLSHAHSLGVSVVVDNDKRILTVLNMC